MKVEQLVGSLLGLAITEKEKGHLKIHQHLMLAVDWIDAAQKRLESLPVDDGQKRVALTRHELNDFIMQVAKDFDCEFVRSDILYTYLGDLFGEEKSGK